VPDTPYLRGQAFDPDIVVATSQAYQTTCRTLGLDRDDLKELVAKQVIELAERGVRTPPRSTCAPWRGWALSEEKPVGLGGEAMELEALGDQSISRRMTRDEALQ
jgi:hypothetical protein